MLKGLLEQNLGAAILIFFSVGAMQSAATSDHYRWLDATTGEPVYSDRPPPKGTDYEVLSAGSSLKRRVNAGEDVSASGAKSSAATNDPDAAAVQESLITKNAELCEKATMNLMALDSEATIKVRNDKGELRELSPDERELQRNAAKAQITVYCE